jgi:predicted metal-dependent peptidase
MSGLPDAVADRIAAGKVLAARSEPYLSSALHALSVREAPNTNTVSADRWWRLYVDPESAASWTAGQWATVLRTESRRLLLDHPRRADQLDDTAETRQRFALASDATVNSDTARAGQSDWPRTAPKSEDYPGGRVGMAVEEVFAVLDAQSISGGDEPHGSAALGERQGWEQPDAADDRHTLTEQQSQRLSRQVAERLIEHERAGHHVSPALASWAQQLTRPAIDWRRALESHIRDATGKAAGHRDYTFTRPSRRRAPASSGGMALLPGMYEPEPPQVAVIRDTSGSMTSGQNLIAAATAEVEGMLSVRARVTLIDTDNEAHTAVRLHGRGTAAAATGGGGTELDVGLRAAARLRPRPHLAVVLTDGLTNWPQRSPLRGVPILVVLLGSQAAQQEARVPDWARTLVVEETD